MTRVEPFEPVTPIRMVWVGGSKDSPLLAEVLVRFARRGGSLDPPDRRSAAIAAASDPAAPGATTTMPRVGLSAGSSATTTPIHAPPGMGAVPVFANAEIPRAPRA